MRFSRRTGLERSENPLAALWRRARTRADAVDLTESNPTRAGIPYDAAVIRAALSDERVVRYDPAPFGMESAREAVAGELALDGVAVAPERVMLTASTSEAYGFLFKILCDPGDEVLVPAPSYPLFEMLARFESVRCVPYPLGFDGRFHLDLDAVRRARTERTRALLFVSPNNPTGTYLRRGDLPRLAALGLPLVCDEVFARYPLEAPDDRARTALEHAGTLCIVLGGLSKLAALPQLKLGWMALGGEPRTVREALGRLELLGDAWLSVGTPVQLAAEPLLVAGRALRGAVSTRLAHNLAGLRAQVADTPASVPVVEGGWYACMRLPAVHDEDAWTRLFVSDGVLVHPGLFFGFPSEPWVVISLLTPTGPFEQGVARILGRVAAEC